MSDLPTQGLLQQMNSHQVSGEHLEVLGKRAAALWSEGHADNLSDAVVSVVKTAGLSPEQVRRVVEFTNTAAYLTEFKKEGASHRVVDFGSGGLASPATVLQDLNDGGGGSVHDSGSFDYHAPPTSTKTASAWEETAFDQMFKTSGAEYPDAEPLGEVMDLRDKLSAAYETATSMLSSLELDYADLRTSLFGHVKQAALGGHALSEIVEIWSQVAPSQDHVKVAFTAIMPMLVENEVFRTHEDVADSLQKHAEVGIVDTEHPLVVDFQGFCATLSKLAEMREAQQELGEGAATLTAFLKEGAGGVAGVAKKVWHGAGEVAERVGTGAGKVLLGAEHAGAKDIGNAARVGVKYVVPAVAAHEAYRHIKHDPKVNAALSTIPGTQQYRQKEYQLQAGGQGYGY